MAIISFWSNCRKETGQTLSAMSIAAAMAINHNFKTIIIGTDYREKTIEDGFWPRGQGVSNIQSSIGITQNQHNVGTVSGIEGLARVVQSGRTGAGIIENYTKPVLRDNRLDILLPPSTPDARVYSALCGTYPDVIKMANTDYNFVFVDVNKKVPGIVQKQILENSDVIIASVKQDGHEIEEFAELKKNQPLLNRENLIVLIGRYDEDSKYNVKNLERTLKLKDSVIAVPHNNMYYEAATEGRITDYFFKFVNMKKSSDKNAVFINFCQNACDIITYKLKALQIK